MKSKALISLWISKAISHGTRGFSKETHIPICPGSKETICGLLSALDPTSLEDAIQKSTKNGHHTYRGQVPCKEPTF